MSDHSLTPDDIDAIARAIVNHSDHPCRFAGVDPKELSESVEFFKNWNSIMRETKSTVRKTLVTLLIGGMAVLMGAGVFYKLKGPLP